MITSSGRRAPVGLAVGGKRAPPAKRSGCRNDGVSSVSLLLGTPVAQNGPRGYTSSLDALSTHGNCASAALLRADEAERRERRALRDLGAARARLAELQDLSASSSSAPAPRRPCTPSATRCGRAAADPEGGGTEVAFEVHCQGKVPQAGYDPWAIATRSERNSLRRSIQSAPTMTTSVPRFPSMMAMYAY